MTVEIRPAATVMLINASNGEVLLMLRHAKVGFMPEFWVFPGGRVDAEDGDGEAAFRTAVFRETIEEAGLILSEPPQSLEAGQERVVTPALLALPRARLYEFARWVTPPEESPTRRYDTRFYAAWVPGYEVEADGSELTSARWLTPQAALALHAQGELWMAPPTYISLLCLAEAAGRGAWEDTGKAGVEAFLEAADAATKGALCPSFERGDGATRIGFSAADGLPLPPSLQGLYGVTLQAKAWQPLTA